MGKKKVLLTEIDVAKTCQKNINPVQILDFLKAKLFERVA